MCIQGKVRKIFFRGIHHFNRVKTLRNFSVFLFKVLKLFHLLDLFKHLLSHLLLQKYHCAKNVHFFWPIFSHIWTEYGDLLHKSLYSVRMRENTDKKKLCIWKLFTQCMYCTCTVYFFVLSQITSVT